jgi:hypothetical protein
VFDFQSLQLYAATPEQTPQDPDHSGSSGNSSPDVDKVSTL